MNRLSREEMLMEIAQAAAKRSTCTRKQIGAVIARRGRPISLGYNGAPAGQPHCTDVGCLIDPATGGCIRTAHAEMNAIAYAARYGVSIEGAELYTTISPCKPCADAIIGAGIWEVWYLEEYRVTDPLEYLRQAGVSCIKFDRDDL